MAKLSFIARMTVKEGKEEEFIRLAHALTEKVQAHEPDCLLYEFFRLREPRSFAVIEFFADEAAEHAHLEMDHFKEIAPPMLACLEGDPGYVREYLDPLD